MFNSALQRDRGFEGLTPGEDFDNGAQKIHKHINSVIFVTNLDWVIAIKIIERSSPGIYILKRRS